MCQLDLQKMKDHNESEHTNKKGRMIKKKKKKKM